MEARTKIIAAVAVIMMCAAGLVGAGYAYTASTVNEGNYAVSEYVVLSQSGTGAYQFADDYTIYTSTLNKEEAGVEKTYYKYDNPVSLDTTAGGDPEYLAVKVGDTFNVDARDANRDHADLAIAFTTTGFAAPTADWKLIIEVDIGGTKTYTVAAAANPSGNFNLVWTDGEYPSAAISVYYGYAYASPDNGVITAPQSEPIFNGTMTFTTTINPGVVSHISLNYATFAGVKDGTVTLVATLHNGATGTVTWSTSDSDVATVTSAGVVTFKAAGTAVITATVGGYTASCWITVTAS